MGNVFSVNKPPGGIGRFDMSPDSASEQVKIENPGSLEDLHKKATDIFPTVFCGALLLANNGFSKHFQVSNTIVLKPQTGFYRLGATYVRNETGSAEAFDTVVHGDISPSGDGGVRLIHKIGERFKFKLDAIKSNKMFPETLAQVEYKGDSSTSSIAIINPDPLNYQGQLCCQYLQSVTPNLALGSELVIYKKKQVPGGQLGLASVSARYTGPDYVCSGSLGLHMIQLCYYQRASDQLSFGVQLDTNLLAHKSVATVGYTADLPKLNLQFKGSVDTDCNVSAVLEKTLLNTPTPITFTLSGNLNHRDDRFGLGVGLVVG